MLAFVGTGRNLPVSFYISALAAISYFVSVAIGVCVHRAGTGSAHPAANISHCLTVSGNHRCKVKCSLPQPLPDRGLR